jgi:tetratricopeptide (TPR) repeat protein
MKKEYIFTLIVFLLFKYSIISAQIIPDSIRQRAQKEVDEINRLIKEKGCNWTAGITHLTYLTKEERTKRFGMKGGSKNHNIHPNTTVNNANLFKEGKKDKNKILVIPNWAGYMTDMDDQEDCPNCWAYSTTAMMEGLLHNYIGNNIGIRLDEMDLTNKTTGCYPTGLQDEGVYYLVDLGHRLRSIQGINSYPNYDDAYWTLNSYTFPPPSIANIKYYLQYSPIMARMIIYDDFLSYRGNVGVYRHVYGDFYDMHGVLILSYDDSDSSYYCRNSWGTDWGINNSGYFKIKYGECGIDSIQLIVGSVNQNSFAKIFPNLQTSLNGLSNFETGEGARFFSGSYSTSNNITIPSGSTLQINSGTQFTFTGTLLNILGTMNASGATFQGNGTRGSWGGIRTSSTTSGTLQYCTIKDAAYGVHFITNTFPLFDGNTLQNNTTALCFNNTGNGGGAYPDRNTITGNGTGIFCTNSSSPVLFTNNDIISNDTNISITNNSVPDFGRYSNQGHNSIYDCNRLDVYSAYAGQIFAEYNWWGSSPAYPNYYGNLDYANALTFEPSPNNLNKYEGKALKIAKSSTVQSIPNPGIKEFDEVRGLFTLGKYEELITKLEPIVEKYSDYLSGELALSLLDECLCQIGRNEESENKLNNIIRSKGKQSIGATSALLLNKHLMKKEKYAEAVEGYKKIAKDFPNTDHEKLSLYYLGSINWYNLKDIKTGEGYFRELIKKYPDDPLSDASLMTLGEWKPKTKEKGYKEIKPVETEKSGITLTNYPNPFNPTTVISFQIPETQNIVETQNLASVQLKVFDILGREIKTLVNENMEAGKHEVQFNAANLASGMYFYRLTVQPSDGSKAIVINKSMQVIK